MLAGGGPTLAAAGASHEVLAKSLGHGTAGRGRVLAVGVASVQWGSHGSENGCKAGAVHGIVPKTTVHTLQP
jgi:hypothetical protein